jgi:hypothetical protein
MHPAILHGRRARRDGVQRHAIKDAPVNSLQRRWPRIAAPTERGRDSLLLPWLVVFLVCAVYLMPYWVELRPGVFSDDSGTYLRQVLTGELENTKPFFFARFLQLASLEGHLMLRLALVLALFGIALLARILVIGWRLGAPWWLGALAVLLLLNPYVQVMLLYIQNDVLFCIAMGSVLAETLWCIRRKCVGIDSILLIVLCAPMALLFRQNGLLFLPLWLLTLPLIVPLAVWSRLAVPAVAACALALCTMAGVDTSTTINSRFPAVIHAMAGLARPEQTKGTGDNLSPQTRALLGEKQMRRLAAAYDPRYWDYVGFVEYGPQYALLDEQRKSEIVRSFIRYDLWPNLPAVLAIRTQLFLNILLGRAMPPEPYGVARFMPGGLLHAKLENRPSNRPAASPAATLVKFYLREPVLRSQLVGFAGLVLLTLCSLWRRDRLVLWFTGFFWIQLAAVFVLMPSADSRYLFFLYLLPVFAVALIGRAQRGAAEPVPPVSTSHIRALADD